MRRWPLLTLGGVAGALLLLRLRDPHQQGSYGTCPFHWLTGLDCPGCGGLRAAHDLASGHLVAAASSNLLLVVAAPLVGAVWLAWAVTAWRGRPAPRLAAAWRAPATVLLVGALAVFTVVRNTGPGAWLAA